MILSSTTAVSSIPASSMTPCWPRPLGGWYCAWSKPASQCSARATSPTRSRIISTRRKSSRMPEFAQIEDAVDRLKRSAKTYDEALAKDAAGLSGARLARLQSLMFDIDQTLAPNVGLPGRAWYKNL